jgi:hypothetical protein
MLETLPSGLKEQQGDAKKLVIALASAWLSSSSSRQSAFLAFLSIGFLCPSLVSE